MGLPAALVGSVHYGRRDRNHALHGHGGDAAVGDVPLFFRLVTLSVVLAIVISLVALWLTFHFRNDVRGNGCQKSRAPF